MLKIALILLLIIMIAFSVFVGCSSLKANIDKSNSQNTDEVFQNDEKESGNESGETTYVIVAAISDGGSYVGNRYFD